MELTAGNIVPYLLGRGLLNAAAVVDGDVVVADRSRRHRNLMVMRQHGTGFFVKQAMGERMQSAQTLRAEASIYAGTREDSRLAPLAALLPRCLGYDSIR